MTKKRTLLTVAMLMSTSMSISMVSSVLAVTSDTMDTSPSALKEKLNHAEQAFKDGNVAAAIEEANALTNVVDSSIFKSDGNAREAKADVAIFQIKAGNADVSAKLIREL